MKYNVLHKVDYEIFRDIHERSSLYFTNYRGRSFYQPEHMAIYHSVEKQNSKPNSELLTQFDITTLFHERQHYLDHIGTLHGIKLIKSYLSCLNRIIDHPPSDDYTDVFNYWRMRNRLVGNHIYQAIGRRFQPNFEEAVDIEFSLTNYLDSSGRGNPAEPTFFVTYYSKHNRMPCGIATFSVKSLWELCAMNAQIIFDRSFAYHKNKDASQKTITGTLAQRLLVSNKHMDYNIACSLIMMSIGYDDLYEALQLGALLAYIALNSPTTAYDDILTEKMLEESVESIPMSPNPERRRPINQSIIESFRSTRDPTFIYAQLCLNASKKERSQENSSWVNEILARSCLPSFDKLMKLSKKEALSLLRSPLHCRGRLDQVWEEVRKLSEEVYLARLASEVPYAPAKTQVRGGDLPAYWLNWGEQLQLNGDDRVLQLYDWLLDADYDNREIINNLKLSAI